MRALERQGRAAVVAYHALGGAPGAFFALLPDQMPCNDIHDTARVRLPAKRVVVFVPWLALNVHAIALGDVAAGLNGCMRRDRIRVAMRVFDTRLRANIVGGAGARCNL